MESRVYYWTDDWVSLKIQWFSFVKEYYPLNADELCSGNFAEPAVNLPNTLGKIPMFRDYPYLLPCVISAGITIATVFVGLTFMKEVSHSLTVHLNLQHDRLSLDSSFQSTTKLIASITDLKSDV